MQSSVHNDKGRRRNYEPLQEWRQAGAEERQHRHPIIVSPRLADRRVQPFGVDGVSDSADDGEDGDCFERTARPI